MRFLQVFRCFSTKLMLSGAIMLARQATMLKTRLCSSILSKCFKIGADGKPTSRPHLHVCFKPSINYANHWSWSFSSNTVNGTSRNAHTNTKHTHIHIKYLDQKCKPRHEIMRRKFYVQKWCKSQLYCWLWPKKHAVCPCI